MKKDIELLHARLIDHYNSIPNTEEAINFLLTIQNILHEIRVKIVKRLRKEAPYA
jgi:hypothetical protein